MASTYSEIQMDDYFLGFIKDDNYFSEADGVDFTTDPLYQLILEEELED